MDLVHFWAHSMMMTHLDDQKHSVSTFTPYWKTKVVSHHGESLGDCLMRLPHDDSEAHSIIGHSGP